MHSSGTDGCPFGPGFVITMLAAPFSFLQICFFNLTRVNVSELPVARSLNWIFFGTCPFIVTAAPNLMFVPITSSENAPDTSSRFSLQLCSTAMSGGFPPPPGVVDVLHVNVTCTPCSLPVKHGVGDPAGNAVRFRLMPPGPCTKIRNVFPAFALVKLNNASTRFAFNTVKFIAFILVAEFARSIANTDVTLGTPLIMKHAPEINRSCGTEQLPLDGVTDITTGALVPNAIAHTTVLVNGPNTLLSPDENVVVTVIVPAPPQHADGNPLVDVAPNVADTGIVALTRLQLTGVTLTSATTDSAIPSPFVSHANVAAVDTVFPGLCSGTPVSASNP